MVRDMLGRTARCAVRSDAGMAVPEYAVGCVAACGFAFCLWKVLTSSAAFQLLERLVREGWLTMSVSWGPWA